MLTLLMHSRTAWEDYFTGSPTKIQTKEYGTQQTLSDTSVHVLNCLFISITSGSYGGALSCTSVQYLLIESSSFFSCKTSGSRGGAVYFQNTNNGQCVLNEVCGYDCCSTYTGTSSIYGSFAWAQVYYAASSKNSANYSSISRCVTERPNSYYLLYLSQGKSYCPSINFSMNKCYYRVFLCDPYGDSNSVTCSLTFSTFTDNNATGYTCILFAAGGAQYEIKSCNVLRNTQGTLNTEGTIYTSGNLMIEDSCILENNANCIFYQGSSYTITVSNCTVDKTTSYKSFKIQNTVTKSFIHALNHMSTQNCHSEYDSAGTLTPIIQSPSSSKKQKICYTFQGISFQLPNRNFFSLISVLVFNLIHPYSSTYPLVFLKIGF
jgi:hypothetical protein